MRSEQSVAVLNTKQPQQLAQTSNLNPEPYTLHPEPLHHTPETKPYILNPTHLQDGSRLEKGIQTPMARGRST